MNGISWLSGFFIGIGIALLITVFFDTQKKKKTKLKSTDLYCFECEIEMPVVEKKGKFFCSNCGLYHGSKI